MQQQRQCGRGRQYRPGERHQQKAVARRQLALESARDEPERQARRERDQERQVVGGQRVVAMEERDRQRDQHGDGEQRHHGAQHIQDGEQRPGQRGHSTAWSAESRSDRCSR
jgi:hypothetical protein